MASSSRSEPGPPGAPVLPIPARIGKYEVIDRLATGGMAEVFICSERGMAGLWRFVVVKRILPHLASYPHFVQMFLAEARYQARLNHPNVVDIYELGEDGGAPYLAMEYVNGSSLRHLIAEAIAAGVRTPVGAAIGIIGQACAGAHAAHELTDAKGDPLGLVHRDVSPQNLMVTAQGNVKLLDFGIAKATLDAELDEHTRTALKGKVHYMAPEQCRQEPLDRRADVFALGVVVWELLAQKRLFKRQSELDSMQAIVTGDLRDLRAIRPDIPEGVVAAIERALEKNKVQRYDSADHMRRALLEACAVEGIRTDIDEVAGFVEPLLGRSHAGRRAELEARAVEKTRAAPPWTGRDDATSAERPRALTTERIAIEDAPASPPVPITRASPPPGPPRRHVALALAVFVVAALLGALGVRLARPPPSGPPLVFMFPATGNAELVLADLGGLAAHLEAKLRRPIALRVADSYEHLVQATLSGEATMAVLPPYAYVQAKKKEPQLQVLAKKIVDGAEGIDGVIYVRESSPVSAVSELAGKVFCFADPLSTTGYALPRRALRRAGVDPDHGVTPRFSGTHIRVLEELVSGACEAGATYSGAYLAADRAGVPVAQLRQLAISGRAPPDAVCAGLTVTDAERARLTEALLAYVPPREGEASSKVEHISGFRRAVDADYDAVRDVVGD